MKRLLVPIGALLLCIVIVKSQGSDKLSGLESPVNSPAQAMVAAAAPRRPSAFGLNLSNAAYWSQQRAFMNLAAGGAWQAPHNQWQEFDPRWVDGEGTVLSLNPGEIAALGLVRPAAAYRGDVALRCRYQGTGKFGVLGGTAIQHRPGEMDFTWPRTEIGAVIRIDATDAADPIRNIDCREANADWNVVFDKDFVDGLRAYKSIRYLDWQQANLNLAGNWARRTLPSATIQAGPQGVALEYLVLLANQAQVDPWFVMPFNADDIYNQNFAEYVRDHLSVVRTFGATRGVN